MGCCCSYLLQHSVSKLLQRGVCSEWSVESLWVWPTLIIFHSIFDTIGESYRPFVLTLLLVMCQNLALTHPNFYLRLGLLSTPTGNHKPLQNKLCSYYPLFYLLYSSTARGRQPHHWGHEWIFSGGKGSTKGSCFGGIPDVTWKGIIPISVFIPEQCPLFIFW